MLRIIGLLGCIWIIQSSYGQDTTLASQWNVKAASFEDNSQIDSAIFYLNKSIQEWERLAEDSKDRKVVERYYSLLLHLGKLHFDYANYQEAFDAFTKSVNDIPEKLGEDNLPYLRALYRLGYFRYAEGKYEEAEKLTIQSLEIAERVLGEQHLQTSFAYNQLGNIKSDLGKLDDALEAYEKALGIRKELENIEPTYIADAYHNLGSLFYEKGDIDKALNYILKGFEIEKENLPEVHPNIASTYNNLGVMYDVKGDFVKAREYYTKALELRKELVPENHPDLAQSYHNLGVINQVEGKFEKALASYFQALKIEKALYSEEHPFVVSNYQNISQVYISKRDYPTALKYNRQALSLAKSVFGEEHPTVNDISSVFGDIFFELSEIDTTVSYLDSSSYYIDKGIKFVKRISPDNYLSISPLYNSKARILVKKEQYAEGFSYYNQALNLYKNVFGEKHPEIAKTYNHLGNLYRLKEDYDSSLYFYQKALIANLRNFDNPDFTSHPERDSVPLGPIQYLNTIDFKASSLHDYAVSLSDKNDREKYLTEAAKCWELTMYWLQKLRSQSSFRESKLDLQAKSYSIYNLALNTQYELWQIRHNPESQDKILSIGENAQSELLLEWLRSESAIQFAGLPEEVLDLERKLRVDASYYEKRIFELEQETSVDNSLILQFRDLLYKRRQSYDSLIIQLEKKYPTYYRLKYNHLVPRVKDIQSQLKADELMIKYIVHQGWLIIISISKKDFQIHKIEGDEFYTLFQQLGGMWEQMKSIARQDDIQGFIQNASYAWEQMLAPYVKEDTKEILILPDGELGYIPFEVLLTGDVEGGASYHDLPYALKKYKISYLYAMQFLLEDSESPYRGGRGFTGFAPEYSTTISIDEDQFRSDSPGANLRRSLTPLKYNQPEVEEISRIIGGRIFLGQEADESSFKSFAPEAKFLHLAMHAVLNDKAPMYSGLVFAQPNDTSGAQEDNFLYAYELYNLRLPADIAVLSACNTGDGVLKRGEGIMSLSRAFRYAGCPNQIMSLWQTEDRAAYEIMQIFYKYLEQDNNASEALRLAKLDYIATHDRVHPIYWANFVYVGNDLTFSNETNIWFWLTIAIIGLGAMFVVVRRFNR